MGQGGSQGQLHLHPAGEFLDEFALRQLEFGQITLVEGAVPTLIYPGEDQIDVPGAEGVVEKAFVQYHADLQLGGPLLPLVVVAQEGDGPLVPAD